ncbi:MAG: reverse transcriptase family protein [Kangiellaceae bacterium]|jgi:hypothetical protein|nr:reverse transcriptase family protein [Kangiellaceae bacterium]
MKPAENLNPTFESTISACFMTNHSSLNTHDSAFAETLDPPDPSEPELSRKISIMELLTARESLKNSARGPDGIPPVVIKKGLGPTALNLLLLIFNISFSTGHIPSSLIHSRVTMIPKPQKDHTSPSNYRPISITSTILKLLEIIITNRLKPHLETLEVFGQHQCAFRSGHSTQDHILRLWQDICIATSKRESITAVFLDIEAAFDTVRHDALIFKLISLNIPPKIIRWLNFYIRNKNLTVHVGNCKSSPFTPWQEFRKEGSSAPFSSSSMSLPSPPLPITD